MSAGDAAQSAREIPPMSEVRVVTFDCAQTLVHVEWNPPILAVESAEAIGMPIDRLEAASLYHRLLTAGWDDFRRANLTRDAAATDAHWRQLTLDWVTALGLGEEWVDRLVEEADRRLFGPESTVFRVYDDVAPTLDVLRARGYRLAIVSNWDLSLHRVLAMFDLTPYFEAVTASLEEGVEKPDRQIFDLTLKRLGAHPQETLHVGDNPIDDLQGARQAGLRALLIDRNQPCSGPIVMADLRELLNRLPPLG